MAKETVKKVKIKLPRDKSSGADPRGVYVAVNGVAMFVPRGVEVEIPEPYYEVLQRSMEAEDAALDYIEAEAKKTNIDI